MASDSPPSSPLSPPPSWFNDEDIECPLWEDPRPASSPSSAPSSPPPSWFRDEDVECPDLSLLATESRADGDGIERPPIEESRNGSSLQLSSSLLSSVSASEYEGEPKGQKRPSEWLDDSYESPAKRTRSEDDPVSDDNGTVYTEPEIELGTPVSPLRKPGDSDVSNITYQGEDSVFTQPVIEPGTPISSPVTSEISSLSSITPPRVYTAFVEGTDAPGSRPFQANELGISKLSKFLPTEEEYSSLPKATEKHGTLSPLPHEWESTSVCKIIAQREDAISTKANEYGTPLPPPTQTEVCNVSDITSQGEDLLSIETKDDGKPLSAPAELQMSKTSGFTSQGEDVLFTEANETEMTPSSPHEPEIMDYLVPTQVIEPGTPLPRPGDLEIMEDLVSANANEHQTPLLRSGELGMVKDSVPTKANELGTLISPLGKLEIVEASAIEAIVPGTLLFPRGEGEVVEDLITDANGHGSPLSQSGEPEYKPEVWANLRGGLCEGLSYFRAYKGSLHTQDRTAIGFLVDKEAGPRDLFGSQIIISSVGGGRILDAETNKRVRCEDAPDDATNIKAIRRAYECRALIAVVAGEDHPLYPCKPPHPYAVLDWFHITDLWAELQETRPDHKPVRVWRMRFEKADLSKPSWWAPPVGEEPSPKPACRYQTSTKLCRKCKFESKEIFTTGWTCLNHRCASFFEFPIRQRVHVNKLEYTDAFLNERNAFVGPLPPLRPELPNFDGLHGTEKLLRHGFVCPECGHCNRRVFWNRFSCESCPYRLESVMLPYPWEELAKEEAAFEQLIARRRTKKPVKIVVVRRPLVESSDEEGDTDEEESETSSPIKPGKGDEPFSTIFNRDGIKIAQTLFFGSYKVRQYFLPDPEGNIIGSFALFISNPEINAAPNGPNELFRQLELTDIGLKRNAAALAGNKLEGLCRHFQQNFGAKYKFGVSVQSKGFNQAPDAVLRVLQRLVWAAKNAVDATTSRLEEYDLGPDGPPPTSNAFNELLALGYMEDDRINYHDDGESELGPTVAALSLGSPSTMRFRPKLRPWVNSSLPKKKNNKAFIDVLEVPMKHGDMMVMHGAAIHRYYEHAVEPMGRRRFALTCRYIDPDKMTDQADRDDAAIKGAIPEHAQKFLYNGEL